MYFDIFLSVERPSCKFTETHAQENAVGYLKTGLERIKVHPVFSGKYPQAMIVIGLVTALLNSSNSPHFSEYSCTLVSALWVIVTAGDDKFLQPEAMDKVWQAFHKFKLTSGNEWKAFLDILRIDSLGNHIQIVYQHLLLDIVTLLIKDRNEADLPLSQSDKKVPLSKEEEQVLRYVAGYVPFALCEKLRTQKNSTAAIYCKILSTWRACTTDTVKSFLEYTNEWITIQNRGGLFHVNDDVFLFFRTIENEARQYLSRENLQNCVGQVKRKLKTKIMAQKRIHDYWCNLTKEKITGDTSKRLLDMVVNLYIKIRIKAFLKVYLDLKKSSGNISKKSEKALRKELAS